MPYVAAVLILLLMSLCGILLSRGLAQTGNTTQRIIYCAASSVAPVACTVFTALRSDVPVVVCWVIGVVVVGLTLLFWLGSDNVRLRFKQSWEYTQHIWRRLASSV